VSEEKTYCKNCSTELIGNYCHQCGQAAADPRKSVKEVFVSLLAAFINWDGKLFRTIRLLLFKPGILTAYYLQGKRQAYHEPLRLFLFSSFIFFFLLIFQLTNLEKNTRQLNFYALNDTTVIVQMPWYTDTLYGYTIRNDEIINLESNTSDVVLSKNILSDFIYRFKSNISYIFWFSLPLFALALKIIYRKKYFLWDHWIFSLHFYSFVFIISILVLLIQITLNLFHLSSETITEWLVILVLISSWAYSITAQKNVYQESWKKTIAKNLILGFILYFVILPFISILYLLFIYRDKLWA
jgi:hypothetical protein